MRLDITKGRFIIRPLNKLADKLAKNMASLADLVDDDVLWDCSKRALVSAWKAGCILWILNNQTYTRSIGDVVEWLVYRDLWSKMQPELYSALTQDKVIREAALRSGVSQVVMQAC